MVKDLEAQRAKVVPKATRYSQNHKELKETAASVTCDSSSDDSAGFDDAFFGSGTPQWAGCRELSSPTISQRHAPDGVAESQGKKKAKKQNNGSATFNKGKEKAFWW